MEGNEGLAQALARAAGKPELAELAAAYTAAWGELPVAVPKDANNPHFGNDYATLEAHLKLIKPVFARHGLALLQAPGEIVGGRQEVISTLMHKSGQMLTVKTHIPLGGKETAQASGSATTYGKRYVAGGIGGLAASDDDGEAASQQPASGKSTGSPKATKSKAKGDDAASYAESADLLIEEIDQFAGTVDEMEKSIRPRVEDLGDAKVNEAYVAKRRALKGAKK